ncbi:MAG: hypothetical protein LBC86_02070 [Oscillospiraceae bacterium]|jgi:hypothetical protein|nr:hypothetical protein [Oscillospiraceae bacterium]
MGFIKGLSFFILNIAIFVIAVRFISLLLDKIGIFRGMERIFGKRGNNSKVDIIEADDVQIDDVDESE